MTSTRTPTALIQRDLKTVTDITSALEELENLLYDARKIGDIDYKTCKQLKEKYLLGLEMVVMEATDSYNEAELAQSELNKYELLATDKGLFDLTTDYRNECQIKISKSLQNVNQSIEIFASTFPTIQLKFMEHLTIAIEKRKDESNKEAILIINENVHRAKEEFNKMISSDNTDIKTLITRSDLSVDMKEKIIQYLDLFAQEIMQHHYKSAITSANLIIDLSKSLSNQSYNNNKFLGIILSTLSSYVDAITQWIKFDKGEINYKEIIATNIANKSADLFQAAEFNELFFEKYFEKNKDIYGFHVSDISKFADKCNVLFKIIKIKISENQYKTDVDIENDLLVMETLIEEYRKLLEKERTLVLEPKIKEDFSLHLKTEFSMLRRKLELLRIALAHLNRLESK